ncbi:MAG: threo-3-hydroxy-L-aspartate ammonia-lyase [Vicinamibacterales bacterium]
MHGASGESRTSGTGRSPAADEATPVGAVDIPTYADVEAAGGRIEGVAHRTPVLRSRSVDERLGATVFFKCENFQRAGAFKFRGAYNALSQLGPEARRRGVLTFSSGNHAQATALAGSLLGIPTTIVMPSDAPPVKRLATESYGGTIVSYDRETDDREAIGRALAAERGLTLIPPYDHPHVIAGQGTAARELFDDVDALDVLLVPCGGGGLLSGCAIVAATRAPHCRVIGVEPAAGDDATRSFRTRTLQAVHNPVTIADGARTPSLGRITFAAVLAHVRDMVTVPDDALVRTMRFLAERMKIVVEPTGALGAAAAFEGAVDVRGTRVGVVVSGGNVELTRLAAWLLA